MMPLVEIALVEQFAPGSATSIPVGYSVVALFNVDGSLFAIDDTCARCGFSLSKGNLEHHQVVCADCGWRYDLMTGCVSGLPALRIDRYDVKVVDAHLVLRLSPLPNS